MKGLAEQVVATERQGVSKFC